MGRRFGHVHSRSHVPPDNVRLLLLRSFEQSSAILATLNTYDLAERPEQKQKSDKAVVLTNVIHQHNRQDKFV